MSDLIVDLLLYAGALIVAVWGAAHIAVTKSVIDGFGPISEDNKWILTQEWIAEGLMMFFIAALVVAVTFVEGADNAASIIMYRLSAAILIVTAILTALTGARTPILPFKICPFLLTGTAILLLVASIL